MCNLTLHFSVEGLAHALAAAAPSLSVEHTAVVCRYFPRGSMELLLRHAPTIVSFKCVYGDVRAHCVTNPDLKLLFKAQGPALAELVLTPVDAATARPPQMQGCGYRWLAKHCTGLRRLELPLAGDRKGQLIPRLCTSALESLTLRDVPQHVSVSILEDLLRRAPRLRLLRVYGWVHSQSVDGQRDLEARLCAAAAAMRQLDVELT